MTQNKPENFDKLWERIESIRKDPESMKALDELIKIHTS